MGVMVANESAVEADVATLGEQAAWMMAALGLDRECELSVALIDEEPMEALHIEWMGEPGPTDVLSFPIDDLRIPDDGEPAPLGVLGDVYLCPQFAARQAEAAGHSAQAELELLLTHGILHCLGFDHAEPEEHEVMFGLQAELLDEYRAARDGAS